MISEDQQRIIIAMAVSVSLSFLFRSVKGHLLRELYSFILGTLLQLYVYQSDVFYVFILHTIMYAICRAIPNKCGPIVTALSLVILSTYHIYRLIIDYGSWVLDVSTVLMTITCKYSMFAYAIQDGTRDDKVLTREQIDHKVSKIPGFLSYLSYCQFLPTAVIGTAIEYKKYNDYILEEGNFKNIPSPWKEVGKDMGYSIILVAIYFGLGQMMFPLSTMKDPSFPNNSMWYLIMFSFFSVSFLRFKYYFAWKFSMGAVHAAGISYQKYIQKQKQIENFKGVQTCNPEIVETTMHLRDKIANWNMGAEYWLRRCIYERSPFKNKAVGQLFTFMVSSFWHGFYGGYYLSFFFWFAQTHAQHMIFKISKDPQNPYVKVYKSLKIFGKILLWISANVLFTVNGVYFQVLSLRHGLKIMHAMNYIPPLIIIGLVVIFTYFPGSKKKREQKKLIQKQKNEAEKSAVTDSSSVK